jgi:tetratricopeptide (TPR) repeat protein
MLVDMPFTGIGLNSFPIIADSFYPGFVPPGHLDVQRFIPHAHNFFVQVMLDLGIPGAAAFFYLVWLAVRGGLRAVQYGSHSTFGVGLLLGLLAFSIYGLVDAVALGAKPSAALWIVLALLLSLEAQLPTVVGVQTVAGPRRRRCGPRLVTVIAIVFLAPLAVSPIALNAALLAMQRNLLDGRLDSFAAMSLRLARSASWGPYHSRAFAAEALAARSRGDLDAERIALDQALALGTWDPSLQELRREVQVLQRGPGVAGSTDRDLFVDTLLRRARGSPPEPARELYARVAELIPGEHRAYLGVADIHAAAGDLEEAASALSVAIGSRGDDPWRTALAARLLDARSGLPLEQVSSVQLWPSDAILFQRASTLLRQRGDETGALFADRLAAVAYAE